MKKKRGDSRRVSPKKKESLLSKTRKLFINSPPERIFLYITIFFCGIFLFLIPPLQGWDETTHFLRAYQVSEGKFIPERFNEDQAGGLLPENIINMHDSLTNDLVLSAQSGLKRSFNIDAAKNYAFSNDLGQNKAHKQFEASSVYSPVAYLPASLGIAVARTANLPLLSYVYFARAFTLISFIALVYFAIKLIPVGKWVIFVAALFPQTATLAVSIGSDALIIGTTALMVALYMCILVQPTNITMNQKLLFFVLALILALTKQPYVLFASLILFIPIVKFGGLKKYIINAGGMVAIVVIVGAIWALSIADIAQNVHNYQRPGLNVDPKQQVEFIAENPVKYVTILGNRLITNNANPVYGQIASTVTWKAIIQPQWVTFLAYFSLAIAFIAIRNEKTVREVSIQVRYGPLAVLTGVVILVYTSLYVSFSIVGSNLIEGINGRYFIPLIPLLIPVIAFAKRKNKLISINEEQAGKFFALTAVFILSVCMLTIIAANYVPDIK